MSKPVCEEGDVTVLWKQGVHTEREVKVNKPRKIIKKKKEKTCTLKYMAKPAHKFLSKRKGKKLNDKGFCIEIQRMWDLKYTILPVIIGATGIVTRSLRKNLESVPGKYSIDPLLMSTILGTSQIIQKVLQCEARRLSGGDHCWIKRSTRKKRPATRDIHIV